MLKQKIKNKEKIIGMYIQLSDISISRISGLAGYDFVWVDTEHSYMSLETLLGHIYALKSTNTPVVVRLPQNDLTATKHILEMGVDGIIFPMVRSADEVDKLIASTLYPPRGNRGFGPMSAVDYGLSNVTDYIKNDTENLVRFIQLEHIDAINDLENIIKNDYIDGYIFGANDLSGSLDMLGNCYSEKITQIIKSATDYLHQNNKYVGIASGGATEDIISHWSGFGADMLCAGADFDFIREGVLKNKELLEKYHKSNKNLC